MEAYSQTLCSINERSDRNDNSDNVNEMRSVSQVKRPENRQELVRLIDYREEKIDQREA